MKPVLFWELRQRRTYFIWWTVVTCALIIMLMSIYPSIRSQADQFNKVINQLPAALRDLKTGGGAQVDVASPVGYLNSQVYYLTLPLIQIIMSIGLGTSLLARDEQNHTLELLLARPIGRGKLLAAKALSGVLLVLGAGILSTLVAIWFSKIVDLQIGTSHLLMAGLYSTLFSLSFGAIAFMFTASSLLTRHAATAIAVAVSIGGYLLATLGNLTHYLHTPAKFLPYHYYDPTSILNGSVPTGLNIYLVGIFLLCIIVSWFGFRHRDIS